MHASRLGLAAPLLRLVPVLALVAAVSGCAATQRVPAPPPSAPTADLPSGLPGAGGLYGDDGFLVSGYHPYWTGDAWEDYDYGTLDAVFFFELEAGGDGTLRDRHGWPDRWVTMRSEAAARGAVVIPTITLHDVDAFTRLFSDADAAEAFERVLLGLVDDSPGIGGLHLDFEIFRAVPAEARSGYTRFVGRLREALDARNPALTLSMFSLAYDTQDVFDEAALARYLHFFVVQGYDLHARGDEQAGPVAALQGWGRRSWTYVVDRYVGLGVPAKKIVMALPYFGYEWPTESDAVGARTRGTGVTLSLGAVDTTRAPVGGVAARLAAQHGLRRDAESGTPYYVYRDGTGWRQGWFEDEQSLREKYEFVRRRGLGGIAIFPLAYGDAGLEAVLRRAFPGGTP